VKVPSIGSVADRSEMPRDFRCERSATNAQEPVSVDDALPLTRYSLSDIANRNAAISSPFRTSRTSRTSTG
jgi:hypothetical protein